LDLSHIIFRDCNLSKVDFTEAKMTGLIFKNCELSKAIFENTNLNKADFRTAKNFSLDPERNNIDGAKFSKNGLEGLLVKHNILIE
jgi:uncharacterized protein YjbI with pentapeptide repeats